MFIIPYFTQDISVIIEYYSPLPWRCDVIMRVTPKLQMRATGTILIVET